MYASCWGEARPQSARIHHFSESVGCLFYPVRKRRYAQHGSYLKSNKAQQNEQCHPRIPDSNYMAERNPAPFPAAHQRSNAAVVSSCACRWQLAPHNLLGSLISPHLNIYECCWTATFHYQGDCLAWGSQSFHPARVCLGALHFIQLQSVFHRAWLPPVLLVLLRKMRG